MITTNLDGRVAVIRLEDPPLNRLSAAMIAALGDAFRSVPEDASVVLLHCDGAGADVRELAQLDAASAPGFITRLHETCRAIREADVAVVAVVERFCFGAHMEVAAACDLRVVAPGARLGMPEVRLGIPSVIDACLLAPICGLGAANRLVFTGEEIDGQEAARIGFADRSGGVDDAMAWAHAIASSSPPVALRQQKRVVRDWTAGWYEEAIRTSIEHFTEAFADPDVGEAMRAFLEKRAPRFRG